MTAMCACGLAKTEMAGYLICQSHCDGTNCTTRCERCSKYDIALSQRAKS